jgi:acetate kinase
MILVLHSGSSSIKYSLIDETGDAVRKGQVERLDDQRTTMRDLLAELKGQHVDAVGHRIVHGGTRYREPTLIDDAVVAALKDLIPLAPLHNPAGIAGIEAARGAFPDVPHVAVFDTAFHRTLPPEAYTYAIDRDLAARLGIRRYGFHGTSFEFVSRRTETLLGRTGLNMIILHLGNGASAAAIRDGQSVETSMGLAPVEGLVMGTRPGDLDPFIPVYLHQRAGLDTPAVDELIQHRSGLKGMTGSNDLRDVLAARADGDPAAALAFDVYCHRIRKYVGAYHAILGRLDAIVFTAGVGEHAAAVRAASLSGLDGWGISVDDIRNAADETIISPDGARVTVLVVPTDEERAIADHVRTFL